MTKPKSLVDGIGNQNVTKKYYDDWATNYDITLKKWKYKAPLKAVSVLLNIRKKFDYCLDLACGTGMFGEEIKKQFKNITIDGCDISSHSFEKKINFSHQYDVVSMIGSMTYCKKPRVLFSLINKYLKKKGIFIFTHRIDLWQKQNFDKLLEEFNKYFSIEYRSRPLNYLPKNRDFSDQIKIRIIVLKKI
jgi:SAM-dependent methyltransferase